MNGVSLPLTDQDCLAVYNLGKVATSAADVAASQVKYLKECSPIFPDLTTRFVKLTNDILAEADTTSAKIKSEDANAFLEMIFGSIVLTLIVCGAVFVVARRTIVQPLKDLSGTMSGLAAGDLSLTVNATDRGDEIGLMARSVQVFKDNAVAARQLEASAASDRQVADAERQAIATRDKRSAEEMAHATESLAKSLQSVANGDLTVEINEPFAENFEPLRRDFNATLAQLRAAFQEVSEATHTIESGARELSASASDLSRRTEQQAAALEETAAALDEVTVNVREAASRAQEATLKATEANQSARRSGEVVGDAISAMHRIERSSSDIANIISVIDEIAFQTNLLALNAGVEAARAGEAGKGFAVVAQEVRELAQRSATAAKEIKALIQTSGSEVNEGVRLVSATGTALGEIEKIVADVSGQLNAIALAAKEQSAGLAEVNTAVNHMDQTTQQNAAMVEQSTAASATLAGEADRLRSLVGRFETGRTALRTAPQVRAITPVRPSPDRSPSSLHEMASTMRRVANGGVVAAQDGWSEF